ncbi:MAG: glycosyltransferase family 2 protein [Verrucomicrobia bacterium]|nr:glycosyltransferase family 2 protein [Verrucomicrobiota bacterium]MCG2680457.1 glycosyltransferase family 2 protein [Kiritimatiellia bacterium]MBU4247544.1 glycosyltransferase family 2 protein [Verrucomicrobiota bacterium]MBU4291268.1 glycosyltransferase family 2 protein [Verrucomicrobiota bacterium]MBU4428980.1 glycosyltransferase family 2 protein [Verrucomicrobiota bacterium]
MTDLSVIAPVYNELENVEPLYRKMHEALSRVGRSYEIILVDDGSTDGTWEKLRALAGTCRDLKLIRLRRNFGQTAAMSAGLDHAQGEIIITMDADLQNDPEDIPLLLERMDQGFDVVSGWRKDRKDAFVHRRLPSMAANALISRITGVYLHDFGCTLKAYRREVMKNVHLYGDLHRFIPALANWVGGSVTEVVVKHHPRRHGKSKYGLARITRVILDLLTVSFLLRYSKSPIQIFGKWGLLTGLLGLFLLVFVMAANLSANLFGTEFAAGLLKRPFWVITPFMLIFFGVQFISMGLLAEIQIRTYHESQGKPIYVIRETVEARG